MRKKIVAGNWKMNMNLQDGLALAKELNDTLTAEKPNCDVIICTPFIHLASAAQLLDQDVVALGAENCADKEKGAFTGEVSAEMVKSTGARYVILGHSERREYYAETPEILKEKVLLALKNGLKVIFCIGETLAEREAEKQNEVVKAELEGSVFNLSAEEFKNIVIAYEPIWAIGTGTGCCRRHHHPLWRLVQGQQRTRALRQARHRRRTHRWSFAQGCRLQGHHRCLEIISASRITIPTSAPPSVEGLEWVSYTPPH